MHTPPPFVCAHFSLTTTVNADRAFACMWSVALMLANELHGRQGRHKLNPSSGASPWPGAPCLPTIITASGRSEPNIIRVQPVGNSAADDSIAPRQCAMTEHPHHCG